MKKLYVLLSTLVLAFVIVACSPGSTTDNTKNETNKETKKESESSNETNNSGKKSVNFNNFVNQAPKGLPDNWESMQFHYLRDNFNILGQKLNYIPPSVKRIYDKKVKILGPASYFNVGLNFSVNKDDYVIPMTLQVFNPTNKSIPLEEAIIVAVSVNWEWAYYEGGKADSKSPKTAFILPKGIAPWDEMKKVIELYGEPSEVRKDKLGYNTNIYKTKDGKILVIVDFEGKVQKFMMRISKKADFYENVKKSKNINDFSKKLDYDAYVNINGHKVKLYSYFKDAIKGLNLRLDYIMHRNETLKNLKLKANTETTVFTYVPGYDYEQISFRLVNLTNKSVSIGDAKIIGVKIKYPQEERIMIDPYQLVDTYNFNYPYNAMSNKLHVIGPLGVKLGEDQKAEFKKIPNNVNEKVFTKEDGAYATVNNEKLLLTYLSLPQRAKKVIDDIKFTVNKIENR